MKIQKIQDKYICKIGKNKTENWQLLSNSKPEHIFFHLSSFPSCYVILECKTNTKMTLDILEECAKICKQNTKYRNIKNICVDCTKCSNVIKGENEGEIEYKQLRKIFKIKV